MSDLFSGSTALLLLVGLCIGIALGKGCDRRAEVPPDVQRQLEEQGEMIETLGRQIQKHDAENELAAEVVRVAQADLDSMKVLVREERAGRLRDGEEYRRRLAAYRSGVSAGGGNEAPVSPEAPQWPEDDLALCDAALSACEVYARSLEAENEGLQDVIDQGDEVIAAQGAQASGLRTSILLRDSVIAVIGSSRDLLRGALVESRSREAARFYVGPAVSFDETALRWGGGASLPVSGRYPLLGTVRGLGGITVTPPTGSVSLQLGF